VIPKRTKSSFDSCTQHDGFDMICWLTAIGLSPGGSSTLRGEFKPRQTRQLPRAVDLKGRFLSCQSY